MKTIDVVAAVITDGQRILATRRGYGPQAGGWEFPGGKIEPGETPEQALAREIQEEMQAKIEVGELVTQVEYDYPAFHLSMRCYRCTLCAGGVTLTEHSEARWLTPEELDSVAWLPPDRLVAEVLKV